MMQSTDLANFEGFYVLEGGGIFILNDVRHSFEKGGTIFIPKTHGMGLRIPITNYSYFGVVTPAGLDGFFHETCTPPGVPPKQLTRSKMNEIAQNVGQNSDSHA